MSIRSATLRAQVLALCGTFVLTGQHAAVRHLAGEIHAFEISFFRYLIGVVVLLPLLMRPARGLVRTRILHLHGLRSAINVISQLSIFLGLALTPLAQATALHFTIPLFASLGAVLLLGEVVGMRRVSAMLVSFAGVVVVLKPGFEVVGPGPLLVLGSAAFWASGAMITKVIVRTDSPLAVIFWLGVFALPVSLVIAIPFWAWPTAVQLFWLVVIGLLGMLNQWILAQAFTWAEATAVLPFDFLRMVWASMMGFVLFSEVPDVWTWTGSALIFGGVLYIAVRGTKLRRTGAASSAPPKIPDNKD